MAPGLAGHPAQHITAHPAQETKESLNQANTKTQSIQRRWWEDREQGKSLKMGKETKDNE